VNQNPTLAAKLKTKASFAARMGTHFYGEGQKEQMQGSAIGLFAIYLLANIW